MKRHESLLPLSRDHNIALMMAQRLILGRAPNPRADWPTDRGQQVTRLLAFYESDLRAHFEIEEAHVFPVVRASFADGDRQVEALIADHEAMRAMIRSFGADPATGLEERLLALGHLLKGHIQREERQLFERMQAACEPGALDALGAEVAAAHEAVGLFAVAREESRP